MPQFSLQQHGTVVWLILVSLCVSSSALPINVRVAQGVLQGTQENGIINFRGIPFAAPPTGVLRWAPPQPPLPYSQSPRLATSFGPACLQQVRDTQPWANTSSEDCLYLNVWAPPISSVLFPVLVWIPGGGWIMGTGGDNLVLGDFYANSTNTVVVSINYRLGASGFLVLPGVLGSGNFGYLDQVAALQWIKANIQAFGGDPSRVTIAGQSAGAISVAMHLTAPASFSLFQRAIVQSDPIAVQFRVINQSYSYSRMFGAAIGCTLNETTVDWACLRSKSAAEILKAQGTTFWLPNPLQTRTLDEFIWQPNIDQHYIVGQPLALMMEGGANAIAPVEEVIMGTVMNESLGFTYSFAAVELPLPVYATALIGWFGETNYNSLINMYPPSPSVSDTRVALARVVTDWFWICGTRAAVRGLAKRNIPVRLYSFMHGTFSSPNSTVCNNAACHACDIDFTFYSADFDHAEGYYWGPSEQPLSWGMLQYWAAFTHGEDLGSISKTNPYLIDWPQYDSSDDLALSISSPFVLLQGYRAETCAFWDQFGY